MGNNQVAINLLRNWIAANDEATHQLAKLITGNRIKNQQLEKRIQELEKEEEGERLTLSTSA